MIEIAAAEDVDLWGRALNFIGENAVEVAAVLISILAFGVAVRADRRDHSMRIFEIRSRWEDIHDRWTWCVLLRHGPDEYYADASQMMRTELTNTMNVYDKKDITDQINVMRGYTREVRAVARFFAYVADEVIGGRVTVREVYAILGPEVARHRAVCYWIAGLGDNGVEEDFLDPLDNANDWEMGIGQVPETVFHEQSIRLGLLYELLWSEMARRGDMLANRLIQRAQWIDNNRQAAIHRSWLRVLGRSPAALWRRSRLQTQLRFARRVRASALRRDPNVLMPVGYENYVRRLRPLPPNLDPTLRGLRDNVFEA